MDKDASVVEESADKNNDLKNSQFPFIENSSLVYVHNTFLVLLHYFAYHRPEYKSSAPILLHLSNSSVVFPKTLICLWTF